MEPADLDQARISKFEKRDSVRERGTSLSLV